MKYDNQKNAGKKSPGDDNHLPDIENKLRLAMEVARIGYWKYDCDTQKVEWSEGHEKLFGIDIADFRGNLDGVQDWVHPDDREHGIRNLEKSLREKVPFDNVYRVVKPDGKVEWLHSYGHLIENQEGKTESIFGITRNITQEKDAENQIRYESGLRKLILEITAGFILIPVNEINTAIDQALMKMGSFVGADRAYIFDLNTETTICSNTHEWCAREIAPEINNLQEIPLPQEWIDTFLTLKPVCIFDVPGMEEGYTKEILSSQGIKSLLSLPMLKDKQCIGFIGFDSVKQHHPYSDNEQQLLQVFADVLISIKLRHQAEEELIAAKEEAEAGNRMKTAFLQNISHEIRTPLNGILGFGQLIAQEEMDQTQKLECLGHLNKSSNRLIQTITNYLDMAQLASGNYAIEKRLFSVHALLREIWEETRLGPANNNVNIILDMQADTEKLQIPSDHDAIHKILYHLLDNAIKFTKTGSITLGSRHRGPVVELFVKDTGRGIDGKLKTSVFQPFMQADTDHTRGYEGSGLGLAIVKSLTEKLDGTIRVESEVGIGSEFVITFPLQPSVPVPKPVDQKPAAKPFSLSRILVADDDPINSSYMKSLLSQQGYETVFASNGKEAVDIILQDPTVDLILMDIRMPVMDGLEATREILKIRPGLPVIALTAYVVQEDILKIRAAGCQQYLSKPVPKNRLLHLLAQYKTRGNDFLFSDEGTT